MFGWKQLVYGSVYEISKPNEEFVSRAYLLGDMFSTSSVRERPEWQQQYISDIISKLSMTDVILLLGKKEQEDLENKLIIRRKNERDKSRFSERVSAIANRSGGHIIVGVDNCQQLIGINPEDIDEEQIQQVLAGRCYPPVDLSVKMISHQ